MLTTRSEAVSCSGSCRWLTSLRLDLSLSRLSSSLPLWFRLHGRKQFDVQPANNFRDIRVLSSSFACHVTNQSCRNLNIVGKSCNAAVIFTLAWEAIGYALVKVNHAHVYPAIDCTQENMVSV
jgi:hypothetical protein